MYKFYGFLLVFRLYLTTKLARPQYSAEISAKVAILDFRVTTAGMESYLLGVTVLRERPDVEAEKNQIVTLKVDTKRLYRNILFTLILIFNNLYAIFIHI